MAMHPPILSAERDAFRRLSHSFSMLEEYLLNSGEVSQLDVMRHALNVSQLAMTITSMAAENVEKND